MFLFSLATTYIKLSFSVFENTQQYSFSFIENNTGEMNLIEIDFSSDIELIKLLCKECNVDLDKFLILENQFNKN